MRVWIFCAMAALLLAFQPRPMIGQTVGQAGVGRRQTGDQAGNRGQGTAVQPSTPGSSTPSGAPLSDEDKANELSAEVGKLMVKCVNLLTAQDPASLDYCKEQRDLADQYPPQQRVVDRMLAHDEYGIALAAFDRRHDALVEFNQEIVLLPKAVKPGTVEWSTAYWHRAMVHFQLGEYSLADRDYRAAEASFRRHEREQGDQHTEGKLKVVLRQHAMVMQREGKPEAAQKLLAEAAR